MSAALLLAAAAQACGGPRIVLFKHFHKAGGTSLFQIARRNARVYEPFANSTQMNGNMDDVTSPGCGTAGAFACEACAAALRRQRVTFVATEFNTFHAVSPASMCPACFAYAVTFRGPLARIVSHMRFAGLGARAVAALLDNFTVAPSPVWGRGSAWFTNLYVRELEARRDAVVEQLAARAAAEPLSDVRAAEAELEVRRDAVERLGARRGAVAGAVGVDIDEARRDAEVAAVDDARRLRHGRGAVDDARDAAALDAHVPHAVEARLRVQRAAVGQHDVEHRSLFCCF